MRCSQNRIITTHVGSLSRPAELLALNKTRTDGATDVAAYAAALTAAVADVVNKQRDIGIDIPQRRGVRQTDECGLRLRGLVELCLRAAGRIRRARVDS